jgi:hypothetical protein
MAGGLEKLEDLVTNFSTLLQAAHIVDETADVRITQVICIIIDPFQVLVIFRFGFHIMFPMILLSSRALLMLTT